MFNTVHWYSKDYGGHFLNLCLFRYVGGTGSESVPPTAADLTWSSAKPAPMPRIQTEEDSSETPQNLSKKEQAVGPVRVITAPSVIRIRRRKIRKLGRHKIVNTAPLRGEQENPVPSHEHSGTEETQVEHADKEQVAARLRKGCECGHHCLRQAD